MRLTALLICLFLLPANAQAAIRMAITIDDLPLRTADTHKKTPQAVLEQIIVILKKHHVPQVYGFVNASHMKAEPKLRQQLVSWRRAGYPLGNHTYSHMDFSNTTTELFEKDIEANETVLRQLSGKTDWHYLRFPYLSYGNAENREKLFSYLDKRGYKVAYVSLDFQDWRWIDPYLRCKGKGAPQSIQFMKELYMENAMDALTRTEAISHVLFKQDKPYILLLHISEFNLYVLDALLTMYEKQGVTFISLEEAMKDPIYHQFGMEADRLGRTYTTSDVWKSWRGPLSLPGLELDAYDETPVEKLQGICVTPPRKTVHHALSKAPVPAH